MIKTHVYIIIGFLILTGCSNKRTQVEVNSLDSSLITRIKLDDRSNLVYSIHHNQNELIRNSSLGLNIDSVHIGKGVEIVKVNQSGMDEWYDWHGNQNQIHNLYKEIRIELKHLATNLQYFIEIRNYNNGVAFRYEIPSNETKTIFDEHTSFNLPEQSKVWYASGPFQYGWLQEYQERDTEDIKGELLAPPATFQLSNDKGYVAITEGALYNYHGAILLGKDPNKVQIGFVENKGLLLEGKKIGLPKPEYYHEIEYNDSWQQTGDIITPWRIITYGKDLNDLVNNNIVSLVNPTPDKALFPKGSLTDWIKPGKSLWTWLTERYQAEKSDLQTYLNYVNSASKLNIDYVTIDEGWYKWKDGDKTNWDILSEITQMAQSKNVGIWVWKSSSERFGIPGLDDPQFRQEFMQHCKEAGVKGVKVDFFHTENFYTINIMEQILVDAARHQLLVVFHGVNKPTGESRTYPNLLAKEAVRGLECVGAEETWAPGPPWPYHNTVLPFTRLLAGPADYTPLHFGKWKPKGTTFAHQVASPYIFSSPMTFFAADPEDIELSNAKEFITQLPVTWDETYVLPQSRIGKIAAIAKRKEKIWYVSVLNGEKSSNLTIEFDFMEKGQYTIKTMTDGTSPSEILISENEIDTNNKMDINLVSGGGFVMKMVKKN